MDKGHTHTHTHTSIISFRNKLIEVNYTVLLPCLKISKIKTLKKDEPVAGLILSSYLLIKTDSPKGFSKGKITH